MWLTFYLACPAEQLGIELPPCGADAISIEDLRRDVGLFAEATDKGAAFRERMAQMQFGEAPSEGGPTLACTRRGQAGTLRVAAVAPMMADLATGAAALVSLAKAWDLAGGPRAGVVACLELAIGEDFLGENPGLVELGPFGTEPLQRARDGRADVFWSPGIDLERTPGQVNYTELAEKVRLIFRELDGRLAAP